MSQRPRPQKLHEAQEKYKEVTPQYTCMVCSKKVEGWYARFDIDGVCSKKCMLVKDEELAVASKTASDAFHEKFNL